MNSKSTPRVPIHLFLLRLCGLSKMSNIDGKNKLDLEAAVNEVVINWGKELMLNVNSEMTSLPLLLLKAKKKKKSLKFMNLARTL